MKRKAERQEKTGKRMGKIVMAMALSVCCFIAVENPAVISRLSHLHATSLEEAEGEKASLEDKKKEIEKKMAKLEKKKNNILDYIEELDKQMADLDEEIETLSKDIGSMEDKLAVTRENLAVAKETEENQYELMKKRIRYMYENGDTNYLAIFFQAESFSDMLNSAEYISKISSYDKNLFESYMETKQSIENDEALLSEQLADLKELNEKYEYEKGTIKELEQDKKSQLNAYNKKIKDSKKAVNSYEDAIAKQEEKIEQLLLAERNRMYELIKKRADAAGMSVDEYGELFTWPLAVQGTITSRFGPRSAPTAGASTYHKGVDIAAAAGTSILASSAGKVVVSKYSSSAGNYVMIYHGDDIYTVYMHMTRRNVSVGDKVKQGQIIGLVGSTGFSTGPHLHFGLILDGNYVNPLNYISYGSSKKVKNDSKKEEEKEEEKQLVGEQKKKKKN